MSDEETASGQLAEVERWREAEPLEVKAETIDPADALARFSSGRPRQTLSNCVTALETDPATRGRIRMNEFDHRAYLTLPLPFPGYGGEGVTVLDERAENELESYLNGYGLTDPKAIRRAARTVAYRNQFDPLREAFDALPMWDGKPRAGHLLRWFLGAPGDAYTQAAERLLFSAVIMRTYHPGCKFDHAIVLIGPQGIGKSTFARLAALRDEWFSDSLKGIGTKEADELLQGHTVVELSELAALRGKALEEVKSFITRQDDEYRAQYDRNPTRHPRRCVLVGTTNDGQFLHDKTGNRRFLPIRCGETAPSLDLFADDVRACFEQAYAELLHEYRLNGSLPLTLPHEVEKAAKEAQECAIVEDEREGIIAEWLRPHAGELVCAAQVCEQALGLERSGTQWRKQTREVGQLLAYPSLGLERLPKKQRVDGYGPQIAYRVPDEWPATNGDGVE